MRVSSLMCGTKGEKAQKSYKEGDGCHRRHSEYCLCFLFYDFMHTLFV